MADSTTVTGSVECSATRSSAIRTTSSVRSLAQQAVPLGQPRAPLVVVDRARHAAECSHPLPLPTPQALGCDPAHLSASHLPPGEAACKYETFRPDRGNHDRLPHGRDRSGNAARVGAADGGGDVPGAVQRHGQADQTGTAGDHRGRWHDHRDQHQDRLRVRPNERPRVRRHDGRSPTRWSGWRRNARSASRRTSAAPVAEDDREGAAPTAQPAQGTIVADAPAVNVDAAVTPEPAGESAVGHAPDRRDGHRIVCRGARAGRASGSAIIDTGIDGTHPDIAPNFDNDAEPQLRHRHARHRRSV